MGAPRLSQPRSQSLEELERVRLRAVGRVPANLLMGLDLRRVFLHAGLGEPHLSAEALIGGGPGWAGFNLIEETLRSLVETWARAGVEGSDHIVVDGLAERIEGGRRRRHGADAAPRRRLGASKSLRSAHPPRVQIGCHAAGRKVHGLRMSEEYELAIHRPRSGSRTSRRPSHPA